MTDIVERLVTLAACGAFSSGDKAIMLMAADAIEERDAEIVRLRALITEWAESKDAFMDRDRSGWTSADADRYRTASDALRKEANR